MLISRNENSSRSRSTRNSTVPALAVVEPAADRDGRVGDALVEIVGQRGGRRLLDELLEAALRRAVPVAEMDDAAVMIAEQLHLDVPGVLDVPLDVHAPVPERRLGLARCRAEPRGQLVRCVDAHHPPSTASGRGLEQDRVADFAGDGERSAGSAHGVRAGTGRDAGRAGDAARLDLVAAAPDRACGRTHEDQPVGDARFGQLGALGQEPVAGMDGVAVREEGSGDDLLDAQVALGRARRPDVDDVGRQPCGERILVGLADGHDRVDALLAAGPDDPNRDLAAVGDQHPTDAGAGRHDDDPDGAIANRGAPFWTATPLSTQTATISPLTPALTWVISFITSTMPTVDDASTTSPKSANGRRTRLGRAPEDARRR